MVMLGSVPARAAGKQLRTSARPNLGVVALVHPKVALVANAQGRFVLKGPLGGQGFLLSGRVQGQIHPLVAVGIGYAYAQGAYPLDGDGSREHRVEPSLRLATQGRRFVVSNVLRLDLRTYKVDGLGYGFHVRPRDAVRFTGIIHPAFKISIENEVLLQADLGLVDMLQLRSGLALHGQVPLRAAADADADAEPETKRGPAMFWITSAYVGTNPVALARREQPDPSGDRAALGHADRARVIDLVVTAGLAVLF